MNITNRTLCGLTLALFSLFSLSFSAISSAADEQKSGKPVINYTNAQKSIVVKSSQPSFTVTIQSNPTTGFSWFLKSFDPTLIKPIKRTFHPIKNGLLGSGGYEEWTFYVRALAFTVPQSTSITLMYARPFDLDSAQLTTFKVVTQNDN
jgi:inhibitor of cysteine peptidase